MSPIAKTIRNDKSTVYWVENDVREKLSKEFDSFGEALDAQEKLDPQIKITVEIPSAGKSYEATGFLYDEYREWGGRVGTLIMSLRDSIKEEGN